MWVVRLVLIFIFLSGSAWPVLAQSASARSASTKTSKAKPTKSQPSKDQPNSDSLVGKPLRRPVRAFLDTEQDRIVQVFEYDAATMRNPNHLMETWMSCEKNPDGSCKNANGWLRRTAEIEMISEPIVRHYFNPRANEKIREEYVRIRFRYPGLIGDKDGYRYGYIEKTKLTTNPNEAFFAKAADEDLEREREAAKKKAGGKPQSPCGTESCPLDSRNRSKAKELERIVDAAEKSRREAMYLTNQSVEKAVEQIAPLVGKCVRKTPEEVRAELGPRENVYQKFLGPLVRAQTLPRGLNIQTENSSKPEAFNHSHLEAVDAIARTIYAEMGSCFNKGLQYPMAVGRMIINRSEATCALKDVVFIQGQHDPRSSDLTKVATTPQQFSLWLRQEGTRKRGPLLQALCPPSDPRTGYYAGANIPEYEKEIWKNSLRIATEMVMYGTSFKNKTGELKARYYYTSNVGWFHGMKRVYPKIMGRPLDDGRCMEIWQDLERDTRCSGGEMSEFDRTQPAYSVPKPVRRPSAQPKKPHKK